MKKTYEKPTLVKAGSLAQTTAAETQPPPPGGYSLVDF
jgi:hypothetical protein